MIHSQSTPSGTTTGADSKKATKSKTTKAHQNTASHSVHSHFGAVSSKSKAIYQNTTGHRTNDAPRRSDRDTKIGQIACTQIALKKGTNSNSRKKQKTPAQFERDILGENGLFRKSGRIRFIKKEGKMCTVRWG